jgi:hypothetical protein
MITAVIAHNPITNVSVKNVLVVTESTHVTVVVVEAGDLID